MVSFDWVVFVNSFEFLLTLAKIKHRQRCDIRDVDLSRFLIFGRNRSVSCDSRENNLAGVGVVCPTVSPEDAGPSLETIVVRLIDGSDRVLCCGD